MKENLKLVMKNAYANISNYKVACIIVMQNNQEVIGVNIENKDGKSGMCAEQVAIANAFSEGFSTKDFKEIHVMGSSKGICMPCFMCRELLHEYFLPDTKVFCYNNRGKCKEFKISDICPYPFNLED